MYIFIAKVVLAVGCIAFNQIVVFKSVEAISLNYNYDDTRLASMDFPGGFISDIRKQEANIINNRDTTLTLKIYSNEKEILFRVDKVKGQRHCGGLISSNYLISCDKNSKTGDITIELFERNN